MTDLELVVPARTVVAGVELPTADELYRAWLAGRSPATRRAYGQDVAALARWLCLDPAVAVDAVLGSGSAGAARLAHGWRSHMLDDGLAPATINRRLSALRSLVDLAARLGVVDWSLRVEGVRSRPYRDTAGPGLAGVRAMVRSLDELDGDRRAVRDAALIRLLFDRGLRRGEVVALDLDDYDPARESVRVTGKGQREPSWLTVGPAACRAVSAWVEVRGDQPGPLFLALHRPDGGRLTGRSVARIVAAAGAAAGLGHVRPHGLRHTAITAVLDLSRGDVRRARDFSRHADIRTLTIYDDARQDFGGELARQLGDQLDQEVTTTRPVPTTS